jgi:hypothetical protein
LVSEAAASTVGPLPAALEVVPDPPLEPAPAAVDLLLLLPHPASASANAAALAKATANARRSQVALNFTRS